MDLFLALVLGYLFGSIPFSQIVTRMRGGKDLRQSTNRNVGASNAIRTIGFKWGFTAGVFDVGKGLVAIWVATLIGVPSPMHLWAGLAAMIGHNYPIWLGFHGGKGVAVAIAVSLWAAPLPTAIGFFLAVGFFTLRRHIVLTLLFGYLVLFIGLGVAGYPSEIYWVVIMQLVIMLIANISIITAMLRKPKGLQNYFKVRSTMHVDEDLLQK